MVDIAITFPQFRFSFLHQVSGVSHVFCQNQVKLHFVPCALKVNASFIVNYKLFKGNFSSKLVTGDQRCVVNQNATEKTVYYL